MILIKIDSLSTQELRNIAQQEGIDGYESMDREDLVLELQSLFDEDDESGRQRGNVNRRFLYGITDYREIDKDVTELPGVEELPLEYPYTEIRLLYKNPSWAYCFWSISPQDGSKLQEKVDKELYLLVKVDSSRNKEEFEVPVSFEDRDWNIGIPMHGGTCTVYLMVRLGEDNLELAHSNTLNLVESYWIENGSEIPENDDLFKIYLSMITTKEGVLAESPIISEIVNIYEREDSKKCHK